MSYSHLPFHVTCLTAFIDEQADDRGTKIPGKRKDSIKARTRSFAILKVRRVQDGTSAHMNETRFHDFWLCGVEHQRNAGLGCKARCNLVHVNCAVATDVVHAHVEYVGPFANLVCSHLHAAVPVFAQHRISKSFRAVRVGALADDEEGVVLFDCDR